MITQNLNDGQTLPKVCLVGRPNVGKSTLFNRLIGEARAITDPTPGVTRDPIEFRRVYGGIPLIFVDTGGFRLEGEEIDRLVAKRAWDKIRESDLILFIMDVAEQTPEDEAFLEMLRPFSDRVILVVNKVDSQEREAMVWDFHKYGFGQVVGVSATHKKNFEELEALVRRCLHQGDGHLQALENDIVLAVLGKPNAGKSTLLNHLTGEETSIVSPVAGTTRDVIEGRFQYQQYRFRILDTAGIRRKSRVNENLEYYSVNRAIKTIQESDVVILMIDSDEGLTDQDKKIAALIVREGKGLILALNKWDQRSGVANELRAHQDRILFQFPVIEFAPILPLSAKEGTGMKEILNAVVKVWKQLNRRVETAKLNEVLSRWILDNPPPHVKSKALKIRYLTQVQTHPLLFVAFVNNESLFPESYIQYLKNRIRKDLGFGSVPLELELRDSAKTPRKN